MGSILYNTCNCFSVCSTKACITSSALQYWLATPLSVPPTLPDSCAKTGCWVQNLRFAQEFWEDTGTNTRTKWQQRNCNHTCVLYTVSWSPFLIFLDPRITNLFFCTWYYQRGKKKFLEAWQKIFRSNGKDPNNSLQKLKFWVGALASWKNFFSFCICTC